MTRTLVQLKSCVYICNHIVALPIFLMTQDIFQAIADPTRRAILLLVATQSMTPNALAEHFDSTRQGVSKHIKILAECQLVKQEKVGREIYYHFNPKKMKEVDKWLDQLKKHWETRFNQLDQVLANLNSKKNEK
jgi:DNA-binding transcriptional ArsR family regulator